MNKEELLVRLNSIEWSDVEFKEAAWAVPRDALSTVSAFANTDGGHLVFGIKQENGTFTISGVIDADKVQNDFLGQVRDLNKISVFLPIDGKLHTFDEGTVIVFYVPEAQRNEKPIFLDANPKKSYIRRGGRDDTCTGDELQRFMRDAASDRFDATPLDLDIRQCFDEASVNWYRNRFDVSNPGKGGTNDNPTFLRKWGFVIERGGVLLPTRAAILVLGADEYVRQVLPRMVVDLQLYRYKKEEYAPSVRWSDRVTIEENLIKAWQTVIDFYFKHSDRPFSVDATTLRRDDDPPDYISFREAAINLLIHQDFGDHTRVPVIRLFRDCAEFFNPGDAFASAEQLLDPGDKEVRNPSIVSAFRRVGLSDQGGTGVGAIFDGWRKLGYVPPEIENDKAEKSFRIRLSKEKLLSEAQLLAQASLGMNLSEQEAAVFAYLIRQGHIDLADVKGLTGLPGPAAMALVQRLTVQALLVAPVGGGHVYTLSEHLKPRFMQGNHDEITTNQIVTVGSAGGIATEQVTVQVAVQATEQVPALVQLSSIQWLIIEHSDSPRSVSELLNITGFKQRPHFKARHLDPLLAGGVLRMTAPDKPTSPNQRYLLTDNGLRLKTMHLQARPDQQQGSE